MKAEQRISPVQLIGEEFDQPKPKEPPRPYLLCSSPRTGSHFLCRILHALGIGVPHEYFNTNYTALFGERYGVAVGDALRDPIRYWRLLESKRSQGGWVGAKLQFPHLLSFFASGSLNAVLRNARYIYLYRRDLLAQAESWSRSLSTGKWSFDEVATTTPLPHIGTDAAQLSRLVRALAMQDSQWRVFFAEHGITPYWLAYEDLLEQPQQKIAELCAHLGCELDVTRLQAYLAVERPQAQGARASTSNAGPLRSLDDGLALSIGRTPATRIRRR